MRLIDQIKLNIGKKFKVYLDRMEPFVIIFD